MTAQLLRMFMRLNRRAHKFAASPQIIFVILHRGLILIIPVIIAVIIKVENR